MCGILGYCGPPQGAETIWKLQMALKIRGLHAFGLSFYGPAGLTTVKRATPFPLREIETALETSAVLIYHNRYSTSGDWQTPQNNQPIQTGDLAVAMNGVLSMAPKAEYQVEHGIVCETENDTEIFNRRLLRGDDVAGWLASSPASCAAVWIQDGTLFALRNRSRPLHRFDEGGATFFISTIEAVDRALKREVPIQNVPPNKIVCVRGRP